MRLCHDATAEQELLQLLLGGLSVERFISDHYLRAPYACPGSAASLIGITTADQFTALVESTSCDLTVVRDGRLAATTRPENAAQAEAHEASGCSLVFRHAERHCPVLARLATGMAAALHGAIDMHLYRTPAHGRGFGWHVDPEEVFIIQTRGSKRYLLRENTTLPAPVPGAMPSPADLARESGPISECVLHAGDCLYIPGGWWHVADAIEQSWSISIGVMAATPLDLLDEVRQRLLASPAWRRRLPTTGTMRAQGVRQAYRSVQDALVADLAEGWSDAATVDALIDRHALRSRRIPGLRSGPTCAVRGPL